MIGPLLLSIGAASLLFGVVLFFNSRQQRKAEDLVDGALFGVSREDQAWMGREARAIFTDPRAPFINLANPSEFDRQMLLLFDLIETGSGQQIDAQIEVVRDHIRHKPFFQRWGTSNTLSMFWGNFQGPLTLRARKLKTAGAWQMVFNWNRLLRAVGSTFGAPNTISPRWIGPDQ
jgi:hypothetical protein